MKKHILLIKTLILLLSCTALTKIILNSESKYIFSYLIAIGSGFLFCIYLREPFYAIINFLCLIIAPFVYLECRNFKHK